MDRGIRLPSGVLLANGISIRQAHPSVPRIESMIDEEIRRVANSVVACPYCRELFSVSAGWFFADNPSAPRDPNKMRRVYVSRQIDGTGRYLN